MAMARMLVHALPVAVRTEVGLKEGGQDLRDASVEPGAREYGLVVLRVSGFSRRLAGGETAALGESMKDGFGKSLFKCKRPPISIS